jgi:hypothetical protein
MGYDRRSLAKRISRMELWMEEQQVEVSESSFQVYWKYPPFSLFRLLTFG